MSHSSLARPYGGVGFRGRAERDKHCFGEHLNLSELIRVNRWRDRWKRFRARSNAARTTGVGNVLLGRPPLPRVYHNCCLDARGFRARHVHVHQCRTRTRMRVGLLRGTCKSDSPRFIKPVTMSAVQIRPCTHKSRLVSSGWLMSALPPKGDIHQRIEHVCFVPCVDGSRLASQT